MHRRLGWGFAAMALLVSLTATIGLIAFRFLPVFAVLTVLTTYQLLSGCDRHAASTVGRPGQTPCSA